MKDNLLYYLVIIIILIILSTILNNYYINLFIYLIILTFIFNLFAKNLATSFLIALFIVLFLTYANQTFEPFETSDNKDTGDDKSKKLLDDIKKLAKISDTTSDDTEFDNIGEKDQFEEDEENDEKNDEKNGEKKEKKKGEGEDDEYTKATKAQKETFRLINTIKQLDDTINGLAPTLKEGAKIIEKFKKLNLA